MSISAIFDQAIDRQASDVHLASGSPPAFRIAGKLERLPESAPTSAELYELLSDVMPADAKARLDSGLPVERTIVHRELSFAGIAFRCGYDGLAATFRILPKVIPELDSLAEGAEGFFERVVEANQGLVLITGATGSGKWTIASSVADAINKRKASRIFVVQRHPAFRFESDAGLVTQFHINEDCDSYERALQITLEADLDVLVVDGIPTLAVLQQMLMIAELGHLVIANMAADGVGDALLRLFESAGPDADALRKSLSRNLLALSFQRLVQRADRPGRIAVFEWLNASPAVQAALAAGDLSLVAELQANEQENRSGEQAVEMLLAAGRISQETAEALRT